LATFFQNWYDTMIGIAGTLTTSIFITWRNKSLTRILYSQSYYYDFQKSRLFNLCLVLSCWVFFSWNIFNFF
jgi:hypothetical protein